MKRAENEHLKIRPNCQQPAFPTSMHIKSKENVLYQVLKTYDDFIIPLTSPFKKGLVIMVFILSPYKMLMPALPLHAQSSDDLRRTGAVENG